MNVLHVDRRKCLLVMEATTFYAVFVPGVLRADVIDLGALVRHNLAEVLAADGFTQEEIAVAVGAGPDSFMKTASKRVLGCMTEQAFMADAIIEGDGGLAAVTAVHVSLALNRTILMPLKPLLYPREAMRATVTAALG